MLYDDFKPIVDVVLNNWTALQLAVEHGMGAPGGKETAQLMSVYVARYCVENIVDVEDLEEVLEDLMDEEFETVCHDHSPREIATLLMKFLDLLKKGQNEEVLAQMAALPPCRMWLSQPMHKAVPPQSHGNPDDDTTSSSDDEENATAVNGHHQPSSSAQPSSSQATEQPEPMDEDEPEPGWTVVKTKRKK
ncbi:hypothetical protein JYU34_011509 [Plutella xylostella]|uniref:Pre-rRNA-processing protein TSR2 homolog n=1 Tax=Plutella xylostella TaxID=51655 RepID=A0ABQ7QH67_PLUXY|nr:uncharacterized protein LOC119691283 [Plutella xylostella]KAG7304559.1 hypothetical protein JYU34_011509 [Plutella xylostella]